jgi:hypothetical protein
MTVKKVHKKIQFRFKNMLNILILDHLKKLPKRVLEES